MVADCLHEPHWPLGDIAGQHFERSREPAQLVGRHFLAEAREAHEVREADRDFARSGQASAAALHGIDELDLRAGAKVEQ